MLHGSANDANVFGYQVSILTRSKERVLLSAIVASVLRTVFQSSPAPKSGCYCCSGIFSIATSKFQSSPAPKSGCYPFRPWLISPGRCFNPHPLQRAGATVGDQAPVVHISVSILTRSKERVLLELAIYTEYPDMFQSSPAPKSGCYMPALEIKINVFVFQSSPAPKSGCYASRRGLHVPFQVSILTRSKERVLRFSFSTDLPTRMFQSSPAPKSGCYYGTCSVLVCGKTFQSSPAPKSGCYDPGSPWVPPRISFNPHPLQRAGATSEE